MNHQARGSRSAQPKFFILISMAVLLNLDSGLAFVTRCQHSIKETKVNTSLYGSTDNLLQRRHAFVGFWSACSLAFVAPTNADQTLTIYNSGKAPKVPGEKPRDKNDVKGTKKDPSFLRSISDCKVR